MVWGTIVYGIWSSLILIHSKITAQRYVHDILQPHVLPFMAGLPGNIFLQDNAQSQAARISLDHLRHITTFPWPARSPDLSSIEHI
ncbi:transposable element Tcb2 transposase [Trichonephila clavipes]|nr:transposable element Tcb2 transposase [Trichonephila clavipes]